jgi:hypothetical protein
MLTYAHKCSVDVIPESRNKYGTLSAAKLEKALVKQR